MRLKVLARPILKKKKFNEIFPQCKNKTEIRQKTDSRFNVHRFKNKTFKCPHGKKKMTKDGIVTKNK